MTVAVRSAPDTERSATGSRGEAIYERDIKPILAEDQFGRIVAIDVDSACWAIGDDLLQASADLRAQHPDASDVWFRRVGYRAAFGFAGHPQREDDSSDEVSADRVESNSREMTAPVRTPADRAETRRRGEAIYERDIKPALAEDQHGRVVAIDVDSCCWAIADDVLQASADLRAQRPEASDVWLLRVGYRALVSFGGQQPRPSA